MKKNKNKKKKYCTLNSIFKNIVEENNKTNIQNLYYSFTPKNYDNVKRKLQTLINFGFIELKKETVVLKRDDFSTTPVKEFIPSSIDDLCSIIFVTEKGTNYYFTLVSRLSRFISFVISTIIATFISSAIALIFVA